MQFLLLAGALCGCAGAVAGQQPIFNNGSTNGTTEATGVLLEDSGTTYRAVTTTEQPQGRSTDGDLTNGTQSTTAVATRGAGQQITSNGLTNGSQSTVAPPTGQQITSSGLTNGSQSTVAPPTGGVGTKRAQLIDKSFMDIALPQLNAMLNVSAQVTLVGVLQSRTVRGTIMARFQPTIKGTYIYDARVSAEFYQNGSPTGWWDGNGFDVVVDESCSSRISQRQAFYNLAQAFNVCKFRRYLINQEAALAYYVDPTTNRARPIYRLSALLNIESSQPALQTTGLIDACSGQVIEKWNGFTAVTTIRAVGGNSGSTVGRQLYTDLQVSQKSDGTCTYSTPDVEVQNMQSTTNGPFSPTSFRCADASTTTYDLTNGGYSPMNDVAKHCQTTVAMFRTYYESPYFEDMLPVRARVHYGGSRDLSSWTSPYANFVDGDANSYPSTTLDIVAHELGHAFTSVHSALEANGEAGGINEAFADITGQAAVFFSGGRVNFLIGAGTYKNGNPMRDMCNPTSDGTSIDSYSNYKRKTDPHFSSGLYNKAFCTLLTQGSKFQVDDWYQVFAHANAHFWKQRTTFKQGVCHVQQAVRDLISDAAVDLAKSAFAKVDLACDPR